MEDSIKKRQMDYQDYTYVLIFPTEGERNIEAMSVIAALAKPLTQDIKNKISSLEKERTFIIYHEGYESLVEDFRYREKLHHDDLIVKETKSLIKEGFRSMKRSEMNQAKGKFNQAKEKLYSRVLLKKMPCILHALIFFPLLPLHLSLQAFFGISRDENGEFVKVGTRTGENEADAELKTILKKINEQREDLKDGNAGVSGEFQKLFPNPDAFLLVDDALWDFYAPLLDKTLHKCGGGLDKKSFNCEDEQKEYERDSFAELIGNMVKREEGEEKEKGKKEGGSLEKLKEAFNKPIDDKFTPCDKCLEGEATEDSVFFQLRTSPSAGPLSITYDCFVTCLREIAAILANTDTNNCKGNFEDDKGQQKSDTFGYKGKYGKEGTKDLISPILESLDKEEGIDFNNTHCKRNGRHDILKKQIAAWGIERAMVVIAGIEKLAKCLDGCIKERGNYGKNNN